jgi:hypothetical protein
VQKLIVKKFFPYLCSPPLPSPSLPFSFLLAVLEIELRALHMLVYLSYTPSASVFILLLKQVLFGQGGRIVSLRLTQAVFASNSQSCLLAQIAGITGMHHHALSLISFFKALFSRD